MAKRSKKRKHSSALFVQRCTEIAAFVRDHGHSRIPVRIDGKLNPLGNWCNQQRYCWRRQRLSPEQVAQLKAAGLYLKVTEPRPRTTQNLVPQEAVSAGELQVTELRPCTAQNLVPLEVVSAGELIETEEVVSAGELIETEEVRRPSRRRRRVQRQQPIIRLSIQGDRERLAQAARMVAESMRPPLIQSLLSLPDSVIRRLWQDHHGRQAPGGQLPMFAANLLQRANLAAHAAVYARAYLCYAGDMGFRGMNAAALIAGLDLYRQVVSEPCITGTIAWYVARDLRSHDRLMYRVCKKCGAPHLTAPQGGHLRGCVFCEMSYKKKGPIISLEPPIVV